MYIRDERCSDGIGEGLRFLTRHNQTGLLLDLARPTFAFSAWGPPAEPLLHDIAAGKIKNIPAAKEFDAIVAAAAPLFWLMQRPGRT